MADTTDRLLLSLHLKTHSRRSPVFIPLLGCFFPLMRYNCVDKFYYASETYSIAPVCRSAREVGRCAASEPRSVLLKAHHCRNRESLEWRNVSPHVPKDGAPPEARLKSRKSEAETEECDQPDPNKSITLWFPYFFHFIPSFFLALFRPLLVGWQFLLAYWQPLINDCRRCIVPCIHIELFCPSSFRGVV